jgi:hypothetical protein
VDEILKKVYLLMCKDVNLISLDNSKGDLCTSYPPKIFIPSQLFEKDYSSTPTLEPDTKERDETKTVEEKEEELQEIKTKEIKIVIEEPEIMEKEEPKRREPKIVIEEIQEPQIVEKEEKITSQEEEEGEIILEIPKKVSRVLFDEEGFKEPKPITKKPRSSSQQKKDGLKENAKKRLSVDGNSDNRTIFDFPKEKENESKKRNFKQDTNEIVKVKGYRGSVFTITTFDTPLQRSASTPSSPRDTISEEIFVQEPTKQVTTPIKEKLLKKKEPTTPVEHQDLIDEEVLKSKEFIEVIMECRFCRTHGRFAVPVIFYGQKYISRSGTISRGAESLFRSFMNYFTDNANANKSPSSSLHQRHIRQWDVELLQRINVTHIIDLMVENRKVKYGVVVCSSEKAEKSGLYQKFKLEVMPYPGRESFVFKGKKEKKRYDFRWSDSGNYDADFSTTVNLANLPKMNIKKFRDWNLIEITQNYLLLILEMLSNGKQDDGLLIHCVSGWDRTPLFISLVRILLWADNEIHKDLNVDQMLYLTVAYDWMLFFHSLHDRMERSEEILKFCFDFLQFIESDEFSILKFRKDLSKEEMEIKMETRKSNLKNLKKQFEQFYQLTQK